MTVIVILFIHTKDTVQLLIANFSNTEKINKPIALCKKE